MPNVYHNVGSTHFIGMASNQPYYGQLQSPPVRLHWAGFVGNSWDMQRYGWRFEMYRSHSSFHDVVVFHHPQNNTYGKFLVDDVWKAFKGQQQVLDQEISVDCQLAGDIVIHGNFEPMNMVPLDMEPRVVTQYISKHNLFRTAVPTIDQQIIIPKELSVDEMLKSILEKQNPNQVEYFKNKVASKERVDYNVSAQIIQLVT